MGICSSIGPEFVTMTMTEDDIRNKNLQRQLWIDELRELYKFKVLILGAGESGKSTVVKQLKFIHKQDQKNINVKKTLPQNTFECFKAMLEACNTFNIELDDEADKKTAEIVLDDRIPKNILSPEMAAALTKLWESKAIKEVYAKRDKYWILDGVEYFVENMHRFSQENYVPTEEDIVMARVRTSGIVHMSFDQKNLDGKEEWNERIYYQVIDVGGQRSERKKWIHIFDDAKAIVFVVNMAGYNMVLFEENKKNRMIESLELFEETVNRDNFKNTPIFLLLNKKDLFEDKLRMTDLSVCFDDYKGGAVLNEALEYITEQFRQKMPENNVHQFKHFYIASRVKRDVKYTFADLQKCLLRWNKKHIDAETKRILKEMDGRH